VFIIVRVTDGAFVARAGSKGSYTRDLRLAQKYHTRELADQSKCPGNEMVKDLERELDSYRY